MANFTTIFFPKDSAFAPSDAAAALAVAHLEAVFPDYSVSVRRAAAPYFIFSGSDFEKYTCPSCQKLVKRYYLPEEQQLWWYSVLWALSSEAQVITVPCCGAKLAVSAFNFGSDVGFARFAASVEGPGEDEAISGDDLAALESALGCAVRQIIDVDG